MPLPRAVLPDLPPRAPARPCRTRDEPELGVYRTCPRQSLRSRPARASDNVPVVVAILSGCARRCEAVIARGVTSHWSDANSTAKGRQSAAIKRPGRDQAKSLPRQESRTCTGMNAPVPSFREHPGGNRSRCVRLGLPLPRSPGQFMHVPCRQELPFLHKAMALGNGRPRHMEPDSTRASASEQNPRKS